MKTETSEPEASYVCFQGQTRLAEGPAAKVAVAAKAATERAPDVAVVVFDRATGKVIDLDLRGGEAEILTRYSPSPAETAKRGRPKLGVVAREVTLLPRHWDWLAAQPGGASVTIRKLIEAARKAEGAGDMRMKTAAAYAFMVAMAGDLGGFEEASRALFAHDRPRLKGLISAWPSDIADEVLRFLEA